LTIKNKIKKRKFQFCIFSDFLNILIFNFLNLKDNKHGSNNVSIKEEISTKVATKEPTKDIFT